MSPNPPELLIQLTKRTDGAIILRCLRRDGSATWQRHDKQANFFSFHDLTHFAVETALGFSSGFYGLIADGWDLSDTTGKGKRGKVPPSAVLVENVIGMLDRERTGGSPSLSAAEFNAQLREIAGLDPNRRQLTDAELATVRHRTEELHSKWTAVAPGGTIELAFDRARAHSIS